MKKFDRLPPEKRKEEIQEAALQLFREKGFAATTMENIVEQVSLSKGGVYRLYASTDQILGDLILRGMRLRNAWYEQRVQQEIENGSKITLQFLVEMVGDSLLLYPEFSAVYVEFLWEKRRNPKLEELYREICDTTIQETAALISRYGAEDLLLSEPETLERLTELMNAASISLHVLNLRDFFTEDRERINRAMMQILGK